MSNPDSFIDEVTEELRRDRLYAAFRKYGWIGAVIVALIVGGAAWREYSAHQHAVRAQTFGDGLMAALEQGDAGARAAAFAALPSAGAQSALKVLIETADNGADKNAAMAALSALEGDASQPQLYRDLATLRRVMLAGAQMPIAERRAALESIAARDFGPLAREQLAYLLVEEGRKDEAITALTALLEEQNAPAGLITRAAQAIVALGGDLPAASAG